MKYSRARLEIAFDILSFIKNELNGAKPTHILYKANLSPYLLNKYLKILTNDGFIKKIKIENKSLYKITDKGINFIGTIISLDKLTSMITLSKLHRGESLEK